MAGPIFTMCWMIHGHANWQKHVIVLYQEGCTCIIPNTLRQQMSILEYAFALRLFLLEMYENHLKEGGFAQHNRIEMDI